jgi:hypothetical protein
MVLVVEVILSVEVDETVGVIKPVGRDAEVELWPVEVRILARGQTIY